MNQSQFSDLKKSTFALGLHQGDSAGNKIEFDRIQFIGTGFLVGENTLITSFHTAAQLGYRARAENLTPVGISMSMNSKGELLVHVETGLSIVPVPIERKINAGQLSKYDNIGVSVVFTSGLVPERNIPLVPVGELDSLTDDCRIAICGYMHGTRMLSMPHISILRIGPLLNFGHVASVNPWSGTPRDKILSFLTDATTGEHISGAPVVDVETGYLIGVHCASIHGGRIGISVPLHRTRTRDFVLMAMVLRRGLQIAEIGRTPQGDLAPESRSAIQSALDAEGLSVPPLLPLAEGK